MPCSLRVKIFLSVFNSRLDMRVARHYLEVERVQNKELAMRIVIAGGTGHLGRNLTAAFHDRGDEVVVLSRNVEAHAVLWDGRTQGMWTREIDGAGVVINLAGRSVDCRYDERHRSEILNSRID